MTWCEGVRGKYAFPSLIHHRRFPVLPQPDWMRGNAERVAFLISGKICFSGGGRMETHAHNRHEITLGGVLNQTSNKGARKPADSAGSPLLQLSSRPNTT